MTNRWPYELVMTTAKINGHDPDPDIKNWETCGPGSEPIAVPCRRCNTMLCPNCNMDGRGRWAMPCEGP